MRGRAAVSHAAGWGGLLLSGAVGSAVVAFLLHRAEATGDAFAGTLVILPLVVAALAAIEREGRHRKRRPAHPGAPQIGGRRPSHQPAPATGTAPGATPASATPRAGTAGPRRARGRSLPRPLGGGVLELAAVLVLAVLALTRHRLGLEGAEPVLAAAFLLLLGQRVVRQVLALRPLLGRAVPERPSALFFFLPLVVYLAILPWSTAHRPPDGDEPYYLLITHSLAYDLDADLTDNYRQGDWRHFLDRPLAPQPGDPVGPRGELYSRHNEALPLLLAPAYRLAGLHGALAVMAALAAALAWMTLRLAHRYWPGRPGEALLAWGLLAFTPPLLLFSYQVWVEVPAALLSMLALDRLLSFRGRPPRSWRGWLAFALPLVLLPLLKIRFMLLAVPLVALAWWHAGRPRRPLVVITVVLALVGGAILVHNQVVFGNPLKIHQVQELELTDYPPQAYLLGATGLFWDAAFGLFAFAPLWMLLLPAALSGLARLRQVLLDLLIFAGPYLLIVVPRNEWYGGWSPPFRYALVALPLLALLLVPLLAHRRRTGARALVAVLALATVALTLVWVVVPGWTYNFADGRTYLLDLLTERLGADVARFFPSSVRPRAATWIWPLATLVLVPLAWWWPPRRGPMRRLFPATWRARRPAVRHVAGWSAAALLAGAAVLPWAAERVPTRRVELEDPLVETSMGHLFPERWVIERTRHRGGWVLREGHEVRAPVVPGGEEVSLRLVLQFVPNVPDRPLRLQVKAGERLLGTWVTRTDRTWVAVRLGPVEWPAGEPLVVVAGDRRPMPHNGVILDRVEMEWHGRADD